MEVGVAGDGWSKLAPPRGCFAAVHRLPAVAPPPDHHGCVELGETIPTPPVPTSSTAGVAGQSGRGLFELAAVDDDDVARPDCATSPPLAAELTFLGSRTLTRLLRYLECDFD